MLGCVKCLIGNKVESSAWLISFHHHRLLLQAQCFDIICGSLQLQWEYSPS